MTLFPTVMALCADKDRKVQIKADEAGTALMEGLSPLAVDAMLPLLFKEFDEHRWQTKLAAVKMFAALARTSAKAVSLSLPKIVTKLMEVSQDPKPAIKEEATKALRECCRVIDNADVAPLIDTVISANMNPDTEGESCLDKLVATTYVAAVDEPTLSIIMPVLLRGLRVKGNVNMVRKAAVVCDTMFKLVNNPADIACFAPDLLPDLKKNAEEIAIPEVREKNSEALNTVKVTLGEYAAVAVACSPVEVESIVSNILTGNAYHSDEVTQWVAQVLAPYFATTRPRTMDMVVPYLKGMVSEAEAIINAERILEEGGNTFGAGVEEVEQEDHDDLAVLCDCAFSLAYGNRVLLHNTRLKVKRGKCYGLIGPNGAGKSTLMRSIAADLVEGFPKEIRSVYVECDVSAADADYICWEFIHQDPLIQQMGKTKDEVVEMMRSCTFSDTLIFGPVGSLSGGWRMRLALSRAMLKEPELLLLDEPTNHVDVHGVAWLTKYVQDLSGKQISSFIVSHDSVFLDNVAQDMVHYEKNRKLKVYPGNLSEFVKLVPEAASYYKLESENVSFSFPDPGMLEGVTSKTKALIKMSDVSFKYPTREENTLWNISVQVSMASRVAVIGVNGAGKSTMIKLLIGELEPNENEGEPKVVRHPNMRLAYVAQHAFHHIENHVDKTPVNYLEWRFSGGMDREGQAKNFLELTEDEEKLIGQKQGQVEKLMGRRKGKKGNEYEVQYVGCQNPIEDNSWVLKDVLLRMKWTDSSDKKRPEYECGPALLKLMMQVDERIAFEASGIATKKLTALNIQKHLDNFNLESQFGTYSKISALSGGQKVKVVLGSAMWMEPHVLILDEPTNFLDRDSLGALATAIKNYAGGCIIISHQREFYSALCPEVWSVVDGKCAVSGSEWMDAAEKARKKAEKEAAKTASLTKEDKFDAFGNKIVEKVAAKKIPKSELKKIKKRVAELRKKGQEIWTDEEIEKEGYEIPL
uniref:ABC transporter domain-containing protein n=1 Tax=Prymnesium polylepis TaxID=72548 RepID=A0A7S4NNI9_9EUKA